MENQHRKIKGYRELNQDEIDLINRIKAKGYELDAMLEELHSLPLDGLNEKKEDERLSFLMYADKDLKQGIMWSIRAIALPE